MLKGSQVLYGTLGLPLALGGELSVVRWLQREFAKKTTSAGPTIVLFGSSSVVFRLLTPLFSFYRVPQRMMIIKQHAPWCPRLISAACQQNGRFQQEQIFNN
jgi:hypothetical protein